MDNEQIRAIEKAARYANNPWPSNGEVRAFREIATPAAVLELISLTRATEAKPSASAAPGKTIHSREFHELAMQYRAARPFGGASGAYKQMTDHIDAAIAAAREEEIDRCTGIAEMRERYWLNKNAEWEAENADLRAHLAAVDAAMDRMLALLQPQAKAPQQPPAGEEVA